MTNWKLLLTKSSSNPFAKGYGKEILVCVGCLLLGSVLLVHLLLPQFAEKRINRVGTFPPYIVSEKSAKLHKALFVVDMHADSLLLGRDLLKSSDYGHVDIPRLIKGNVALQTFTVVTSYDIKGRDVVTGLAIVQGWPFSTWTSFRDRALHQATRLHETSKRSNGQFIIIMSVKELDEFIERRSSNPHLVSGLLGVEGAQVLEKDIANIDVLYNAGFRLVGLTHFFDNEVSGSSHSTKNQGLTEFGKQAVKRMDELGILIDLAHASPATIDDVLTIAAKPLIVSHTGVKGVADNERNLSDAHIKGIAKTGGVICIGYWATATGGNDAKAVARSIRYVADLVGVQHVGLGSDFDGGVKAPFDASGMSLITEALLEEDFSEADIRLIMGENVLRVLRANLS